MPCEGFQFIEGIMTQGVLQRQIGLCHCFQVFQEGIGGLPEGKCREGALRRIHHAGFGKDLNGTRRS